ncbi:MAG: 3-hydroxyacyl-CoA dehydrogenase family protein [Jatrophihabitans sp.]
MSEVGIVGAGVLGTRIAQACVAAGHAVRITDHDRTRIQRATHGEKVTDLAAMAGCDILIEAIHENAAAKTRVLKAMTAPGGPADDDTLLLTTTSSFTVTELGAGLDRPEHLVGLHALPTAGGIRMAEVAAGVHSAASAVAAAYEFAADLGWRVLVVADRPGRLTRRLLMPFINQVVQAYDDGLASAVDIDRVAELGLGHSRGPLALLEETGVADHLAATRATYEAVHDPALAPPPILARLVAAAQDGAAHFHQQIDLQNGARQP